MSSSITRAVPVANSWPLTNTLPKAVMAPDDVVEALLGVEVLPELSLPPPPPQAPSASAMAKGRTRMKGACFMVISVVDGALLRREFLTVLSSARNNVRTGKPTPRFQTNDSLRSDNVTSRPQVYPRTSACVGAHAATPSDGAYTAVGRRGFSA